MKISHRVRALDSVRDGDVLIVWKLDRLGRSLSHLIEPVASLEKRGVGFCSLTEAIDTITPGGRLIFHLFGALGIREPMRAGLIANGLTVREAAARLKIGKTALYRALSKSGDFRISI